MATKWTSVQINNAPSGFSAGTMLLLTDGSVMIHGDTSPAWVRLTPGLDTGSGGIYAHGAFATTQPMSATREYYASGVLSDGRMYVIGAEVPTVLRDGETFDPQTGAWTAISKPSPAFDYVQSDVGSCVLADGRVLLGGNGGTQTAIWDPSDDSWVNAGTGFGTVANTKRGGIDEETWTLLPDGSVLTVEIAASGAAERYVPSIDKWVSAGAALSPLALMRFGNPSVAVGEIGPALVLPNGKVLAIGATGATGIYTPAGSGQAEAWTNGPSLPLDAVNNQMTAIDAPAVLTPGGRVICVGGSTTGYLPTQNPLTGQFTQYFSQPLRLFEWDPSSNVATMPALPDRPQVPGQFTFQARFLVLPTGQLMMTVNDGNIYIYTPDASDGTPDPAWSPVITEAPSAMSVGHTYPIFGQRLNGLSQGASYGDDAQMASNYPLATIVSTADSVVRWARTHDHATMGLATDQQRVWTYVDVPTDVPDGPAELRVIVNGLASDPVTVQISRTRDVTAAEESAASLGHQGDNQLGAVFVGLDGGLHVVWAATGGPSWRGPAPITLAGIASPGATVALARQGDNQLDAAFVGLDGGLHVVWAVGESPWQGPAPITPAGVASPEATVALAHQGDNQLDAVFVGLDGGLHVVWAVGESPWQGPAPITPAGVASPGASVALGHQGDNQLDAVFVGLDGGLHVVWAVGGSPWQGPAPITLAGIASPGATVALARQGDNQLDAAFVGLDGGLHVVWAVGESPWQGPAPITPAGVASPEATVALAHQGDNQLDVLFVGRDGALHIAWAITGGPSWVKHKITPAGLFAIAPATKVAATDILWHHSVTGETQIWDMNGPRVRRTQTVLDPNGKAMLVNMPFSIVGAGDFDQDGLGDILWHHRDTGETQIWYMNGPRVRRTQTVLGPDGKATLIKPPFSIVGVGDFNRDGYADILWHHRDTGETQIWYMDGYQVNRTQTVLGPGGKATLIGPPFRIVGVGDFNQDGFADILWYNSTTGESQIWYMNGPQVSRTQTVLGPDGKATLIGPPFSIVGTGNFITT